MPTPAGPRRMRERLGLEPNSRGHAVLRDRDTARRANHMHPAQADPGGRDRHAGPVILRMVDDRVLRET